jgi:hypothetical protein
MNKLHFQVDSRLATLLSQEYSSTERALKELIDNAWDADAETVSISLPAPMSGESIVIVDDGNGMTEEELRRHYMNIASDRRVKRGDRTAAKQRQIKGRKGIGKFAGLMAASIMSLTTRARGKEGSFTLRVADLDLATDIEQLPLDFTVTPCDEGVHGTSISLSSLHQGLAYPDANRLRQLLIQEYGRQSDFNITVNGKKLDVDDVQGTYTEESICLAEVGEVSIRFSISDGKAGLREPGITLKVNGKTIGKPSFFGLDDRDDFPPKLLKKLYGEINADGLSDHVTAGWDSVVENSELYQKVTDYAQEKLHTAFTDAYGMEIRLAQARLKKAVHERLAVLPEHKREYAEKTIKKVLEKYYDEPPSKIEPIVFVILEALERSDYRAIVEHLADASRTEISAIADSLNEFGIADIAFLVEQARARDIFLSQLEQLSNTPTTHEATMHKALENNLWVFGPEYSLFSSNQTLRRQLMDFLDKEYQGERASKRPDLVLNENLNGEYLLIEFKRPLHPLNHNDYLQAISYRHDFQKHITKSIKVLVVGGRLSTDFPISNREPSVSPMLFSEIISTARRQVQWLLRTGST